MRSEDDDERTGSHSLEQLVMDAAQRLDRIEALSHDLASQLAAEPAVVAGEAEPDEAHREGFEVVLVCTGNRFRSPIAEAFLRKFAGELPIRASSLGTLDLGQVPALPEALKLGPRLGVDISEHRARPLAGVDLAGVDLVLGFERAHVGAAVLDAGAPRERTFTLPELVDLLEQADPPAVDDPLERARAAIATAHEARLAAEPGSAFPELADPLGGSARLYQDTASALELLSRRLVAGLFGLVPADEPREPEPARGRGFFRRSR